MIRSDKGCSGTLSFESSMSESLFPLACVARQPVDIVLCVVLEKAVIATRLNCIQSRNTVHTTVNCLDGSIYPFFSIVFVLLARLPSAAQTKLYMPTQEDIQFFRVVRTIVGTTRIAEFHMADMFRGTFFGIWYNLIVSMLFVAGRPDPNDHCR